MTTNYYVVLNTSNLPTAFYGDDIYPPNADGSLNAAIPAGAVAITQAQWAKAIMGGVEWNGSDFIAYTAPYVPTGADVDTECDRRLSLGFTYNGAAYQSDPSSIANILGAAQLAYMAIVAGAQAGDYGWAGTGSAFYWIATDNSQVNMDAQTVVAFAKTAALFRTSLIYTGRGIKNQLAAGATIDIYADATWASATSGSTGPTGATGPTGPSS